MRIRVVLALPALGLLLVALSGACRSAAPTTAASPAPSRSSDIPLVTLTYPPASSCAPQDGSHDYDAEAYTYARRVDAVAAEVGRAFHAAGGGAAGASRASATWSARRDEIAKAWRSVCGGLPARVSAPTLNILQEMTSAAVYRVCDALRAKEKDAVVRADLDALCSDFKATLGQR